MMNVFLYPGPGEERRELTLSRKENQPGEKFFLLRPQFSVCLNKYRHFLNNFETNTIPKDGYDKIL